MSTTTGELVTETFGYDGGRAVTVYVPPGPPEAVVFAGDGQLIARWGGALEAADVPPVMIVGAHRAADGTWFGERHDPETHLIPLLIRAVVSGEPITIFGDDYETPDGTCIRDYIHVNDLAEAHVAAIEKLLAGGTSDVFNVGTGAGHSVLEVMQAVEQVTGQKVPHQIGQRREGDPAVLVANSDKLKRTLGWTPKFAEIRDIVATAWQFERSGHE